MLALNSLWEVYNFIFCQGAVQKYYNTRLGNYTVKTMLPDLLRLKQNLAEQESRIHSCSQCENQLTRKDKVKQHKQTIHEVVRYECNQFPQHVSWKKGLKKRNGSKH